MANTIHFVKMHGAGNDYIYVNTLIDMIPDPIKASKEWSKPHFGIGSDGLVLIGRPSDSNVADFSMHIYNADGSEAMMCGNASRCIGKYLYEKGFTKNTRIKLETLSGVKVLNLHLNDENKVGSVTVDMLEPITEMPEQFTGKHPSLSSIPGADKGVFVSMGNPHYVIFVDDISDINIAEYGKILERDQAFPQRCNIEFAQLVGKDKLRTRVWERGSGITMACGTGACATATAAIILGLTDRKVDIIMDGGTLNIEWNKDDGHIYMTGPAEFVFEGEIQIP
ncbi:MAG: diaminopimelate epimerase [Prevotella sp.]|nr:diaminopimelate epimerase [Prevotella sp.]